MNAGFYKYDFSTFVFLYNPGNVLFKWNRVIQIRGLIRPFSKILKINVVRNFTISCLQE